jgi:hypothetical protein
MLYIDELFDSRFKIESILVFGIMSIMSILSIDL